jgi:uncharacterized protein YuzE
MKVTYDSSVDAAYIYILETEKVNHCLPIEWLDGIFNLDFSKWWKLVWIELVPWSKFLSKKIISEAEIIW